MRRTVALAMDDAYAAPPPVQAVMQKTGDQLAGLIAVQAMQVDFILDHPAATAQVAQDRLRQAITQVGRLVAAFEAVLQRDWCMQAFMQHRPAVGQRLLRYRRRQRLAEDDPVTRRQRSGIRHRRPEGRKVVRVDHRLFSGRGCPGNARHRAPPCNRWLPRCKPACRSGPARRRQRRRRECWSASRCRRGRPR